MPAHRRDGCELTDRGSTLPLILGFVVVALLTVAGSIAAGDAFVQQRDLQHVCDGAAAAAAAQAVDLGRDAAPPPGALRFADVDAALRTYLDRDAGRREVQVVPRTGDGGALLTLQCVQTQHIAFGAVFGLGAGVRHVATASVRAPISEP